MTQRSGIKTNASDTTVYVVKPSSGWRLIDVAELWRYRELSYFLVWREVKGRYAQSILGVGWAVLQPVASMIVFSLVFGNLLDVDSDGVPYPIFSYTALVPWVFFSQGLNGSAVSLIQLQSVFTKVYFPRLIMPVSAVMARLVDFSIAFLLIFLLMGWFRMLPSFWVLLTPLLTLLMLLSATGLGMWMTALAIQYRDIRFGLGFAIQLSMFASPVVYSTSVMPEKYRMIYALNPMVGVIEGFRVAVLGNGEIPWDLIVVATVSSTIIFLSGVLYFRRMERVFADVA